MARKNKTKKKQPILIIFLALALLCIIIVSIIFLFPEKEKKTDFSELNGFYKITYINGYDLNFHNSTDECDYSYQGISLTDGDKIVNARVLSNVLCKFCGKNETTKLPSENSKITLDLEGSEIPKGDIFFDGTGTELKDIKIVQ